MGRLRRVLSAPKWGLPAHGAGRYPCEQGRTLYGPNVVAPRRMRGTGSSCELKFIGNSKETESPSNDAMVSGASKFPGLLQPVSKDFPKE